MHLQQNTATPKCITPCRLDCGTDWIVCRLFAGALCNSVCSTIHTMRIVGFVWTGFSISCQVDAGNLQVAGDWDHTCCVMSSHSVLLPLVAQLYVSLHSCLSLFPSHLPPLSIFPTPFSPLSSYQLHCLSHAMPAAQATVVFCVRNNSKALYAGT